MSTWRSFRGGRFGKARIAIAGLLVVAGLLWGVSAALAVHDNGMFELDGNVVHNSATTPPYDWASLFGSSGNQLITPDPVNGPLLADTFVSDSTEPDQSYFASDKDIYPIASGQTHWACTPSNNPLDKDNLLNAYAALVQVPANAPDNAGHQVLYLASERGSNNGTSFAGFWLLKDNNVGCSGSNDFSGHHTDGDLLVVSDYTNGGGTQDVTVYRWTGNDANGVLVQQTTFNGSICGPSLGTDNACAIANDSTITTPWSPTSHASNTFVEAGIDLTTLLGANGGCFTTFLAETRSSNQLTATLKDFAGGQFSTCVPPTIATTATPGGSLNPTGVATQHDVATISPVGGRSNPTGTITFFLCNPSQVTAGGCVSGGTQVGNPVPIASGSATSADASGSLTTATGKYCWRAEYAPDAASSNFYAAGKHTDATEECFTVVHASPTISTQIAVTGANAPGLGFTTLGDTAQLHGFIGSVTGETVTFKLYGPFVGAVPSTCTAGSPAFTTTGSLNASGQATTSSTYSPTAAGTYVWIASYPGDSLNDPITGTCSDANESATIVAAQIDVAKSANPPGPVSAGSSIGFDLTVTNDGSVPATGVHVHDVLPGGADGVAGGDLNWQLDPPYTGCSITGAVGSQVLDCNFSQVNGPGSLPVIHIDSSTSPYDCGTVKNKASITTTNGTGTDSDVATVTVLCPALTIDKTADAASVTVGSPIGFTVTASNNGQGTATGVLVDDPLPAGPGISWSIDNAGTSGPLTCGIASGHLTCTGSLAAGATEVVHVTSPTVWNADHNSCGKYDNTAQVSASNVLDSPSADASTTVLCPDLHIAKTHDAASVNAGSDIGFTITASNAGLGSATGALVNDPLPTGVTWSIDGANTSGPLTCGIAAGTLTCTGTLDAGATETVHITAPTTFADCGEYDNTATLTATNTPQHPSDGASTTVNCADVVVSKAADAASVSVGSDIGFTVSITNQGAGAALGVDVEDPLPAGQGVDWAVDSSTGPLTCSIAGSPPSETLKCTGDLAASGNAGDSQSVHVTSHTVWNADLNSCDEYDNTATLTWNNGPAAPVSSNLATETVLCPDVTVTKKADHATVNAGEDVGFTVTVSNGGPGTATAVTLHDPLPAGTATDWVIDPAYSGAGTCAITGSTGSQVLDCSFGDMAKGDSASVHISAGTSFDACTKYDNTATAHSTNEPGIPPASDTTTCLKPDLSVTKTADQLTVDAGDNIGFTISVSNAGPGTAKNVVLDDPLPAGSGTSVTWSIDSGPTGDVTPNCAITGAVGSQELKCDPVDLGSGKSFSLHITAKTSVDECTRYDNTATATADNAPEAQDSAHIACNAPLLSVTKTADHATVNAGDDIGFTIAVSNIGQGTAKNVVLDDPLPAGSGTGVTWSIDSGPTGDVTPTCAITGAVGSQELKCDPVDLGSGKGFSLHVTATTSFGECTVYDNRATATSDNTPEAHDSAGITCNKPDLSIEKTADHTSVNAGEDIGFTITVSNSDDSGTGTAKHVVLDDLLPAGSGTGVSWSIDSGPAGSVTPTTCDVTGAVGSQELTCSAVDLDQGDSYTLHITAKTSFAECTEYDNTATATAANAPTVKDEADITCHAPDLSITKTADAATVSAGQNIGFAITVSNSDASGTGTAKNVTLDDPLPAGTAWSIDSGPTGSVTPATCEITGALGRQELTCSGVDLGRGDSYTVHVTAGTSFAACTEYDNTATASADNAPQVEDSADITCNSPAVSITKTADHSAPVHAGDQIGFTVEVKNTGKGDATGVVLNDALPAGSGSGVTWAIDTSKGTPAQFVLSGAAGHQTLSLASGTLPAGADYTVHVVASTSQTECSVYDNTATLTTENANNPAPASASESCAFRVDLSVTKAGSPATQDLGAGNITWTIVVTNNGPDNDTGVTIADPMPAGNTFVSAATSQGSCTGGAILTCNIGPMAAGASVTITLVTTPSTAGTQTNTVTVAGDRPETNTANNQATATVQITAPFIPPPVYCVAVSKVTPNQLFVGRSTKLTIHVTRHGRAVKGVHVRIKGPKIDVRTAASNGKGVIKRNVKMTKAGILIFSPIASKRCNTKRVGVTNVFTPPVTG